MSKPNRLSFMAASIFVAGLLLSGCGRDGNGARGPAKAVSTMTPATTITIAKPVATIPTSAILTAYDPEPAVAVIGTCNIEAFDQVPFQSAPADAALGVQHNISGWIAAPQLATPSFWLRFDDKAHGLRFQTRIKLTVKRPDVAAANTPPLPEESGFTLDLPANAVPAGQYHLYLVARADGKSSVCDDGRQVDFK